MLIIEDEIFIAMRFSKRWSRAFAIARRVARTHGEAVALAKSQRLGLILADIKLADGSSGLDAVDELISPSRCR